MIKLFLAIERLVYQFRDFMWSYPDLLVGRGSFSSFLGNIYRAFTPISHFLLTLVCIFFIIFFSISSPLRTILAINQDTLIEGVVVEVDQFGNLQKVTSINPLISSNLQVQRDLVELIYEPLLKIQYSDNPTELKDFDQVLILAKEIVEIKTGAEYIIVLKDNVFWHDDVQFTAQDVVATFDLVSKLDNSTASVQALKQMNWEAIGNGIRICTKINEDSRSCNDTTQALEPLFFSNFLELISIKILPAHKITDITPANFDSSIPELFRAPVGTGPFKFSGANNDGVSLSFNQNYHSKLKDPQVRNIRFKYFRTLESALSALRSGEIHSTATASTEFKRRMAIFPQVKVQQSRTLYNQYWGIYLNQRTNPDGNTIGSTVLRDPKFRKAISLGLDREEMLAVAMESVGTRAQGPIPPVSNFYNKSVDFSRFALLEANALLDQAGWSWTEGELYRKNSSGDVLNFRLYFVDSFDRRNLANYIQTALARIGVQVILPENPNSTTKGWSLEDINNQFLTTGLFDALIYGVNTFVDPDRFELFHSSQSRYPGLNLGGYVPLETTKIIGDVGDGRRDVIDYPKIDRILEQARGLNPVALINDRAVRYAEFQELLQNDMPVIFLYHPQFLYYTSRRVAEVDLSSSWSVEERFRKFWNFEILN